MKESAKIFGKDLRLSWPEIILCLASMIFGLLLAIWPDMATSVVIYGIGGVGLIIGGVHILRFYRMDQKKSITSNDLAIGIIFALFGLLFILLKRFLLSLLPVFFGLIILVGGIVKLQSTLNFKRMGAARWYIELICSGAFVLLGAIILLNPFSTALLLMRVIGVTLLVWGVQNLISRYTYKKVSTAYFVQFEEDNK